MNVLSDSLSVLIDHWRLIAGILLIILPCQILIWAGLKLIFGDRLTSGEYYSLSIAGWILPLLLAALPWLLWNLFQRLEAAAAILFFLVCILAVILGLRARKEPLRDSKRTLLILLILSGLFIFLRLAFVSRAAIPLYFDSAQHYLIIKNLLANPASGTTGLLSWLTTVYYHMGFHLAAAFIISILHTDLIDTILILGQIILAVIPLALFLIIKHETQSSQAGIYAVLLAAFGWYMPAHAMDWGKYPALTSLLSIAFVLSLAYLSVQLRSTLSPVKYWSLKAVLFSALVASILIHSRSLVIFGLVVLAWIGATAWQRLPKLAQLLFLGMVILGIGIEIYFIQTKDVLGPLFDPYANKGLLVTGIVLFLILFAQWAFPKLAFASILVIFLLLGSLFIPVQGIPGYIDLTLLDRPFVELIFFLPLSLLGGLGLAGLERSLRNAQRRFASLALVRTTYVNVLFVAVLLINAFFKYEVYPSGCCSLVGRDDLVAIDWMDNHLPTDARVLISTTELMVLATDSFQGSVGADAGIWINPLTGRATLPLPYFSDFGQQATLDSLCSLHATHIYIGETGLTFDDSQIAAHPDWYKNLLSMPKVKVYQVVGCK